MRIGLLGLVLLLIGCEPKPSFPMFCDADNPDRPWPFYMKSYPRAEAYAMLEKARAMGFMCSQMSDCGGATVAEIMVSIGLETDEGSTCFGGGHPIEFVLDLPR